jgi:hypothetical protein
MRDFCRGFVAGLALILTLDSAEAATAGHMFRSTTPTGPSDQDVTSSIKRSSSIGGDVTRADGKPAPTAIAKPKVAPAH